MTEITTDYLGGHITLPIPAPKPGEKHISWQLRTLQPPIWLNLRPNHKQYKDSLSHDEISYLLNANPEHPNAWIFIHGYHVEWGNWSHELLARPAQDTSAQFNYCDSSYQKNNTTNCSLYYGSSASYVLRQPTQVLSAFPGATWEGIDSDSDQLNGDGCQNWWLHLEYNLNQAAGFDGFSYRNNNPKKNYFRMIHVAWDGNPLSPLDYLKVEENAIHAAKKLVKSIQQLAQEKISIHMIAHSAGSIVLLHLMELLGKNKETANLLEHVFFWQSAIPNTSLSPKANQLDNTLRKHYQTQNAHKSSKKIHVFFSTNDNVLGPLTTTLKTPENALWKKWQEHDGGSHTFSAILINTIDRVNKKHGIPRAIHSLYHLAQLLGAPLHALLNSQELRLILYQHFLKQVPKTDVESSLEKQVLRIATEHPDAFNNLSLFISLFYALQHDLVQQLSRHSQFTKKSKKLSQHLPIDILKLLEQEHASQKNNGNKPEDTMQLHTLIKQRSRSMPGYQYLLQLAEINQDLMSANPTLIEKLTKPLEHTLLEYAYHQLKDIAHWPIKHSHKQLVQCMKNQSHHSPQHKTDAANALSTGNEFAALLITLFYQMGIKADPAMGYAGPDLSDPDTEQLLFDGKINVLDQSSWLMHHSAMKIPNADVIKHVYQHAIVKQPGIHFGRWNDK